MLFEEYQQYMHGKKFAYDGKTYIYNKQLYLINKEDETRVENVLS